MKWGLLKLDSLSPWKLILVTSPQGHGSDMLILFPFRVRACVRVCFFVWRLCASVKKLKGEA